MSVQKVYRPQFLMEPAEGPGAGGSGGGGGGSPSLVVENSNIRTIFIRTDGSGSDVSDGSSAATAFPSIEAAMVRVRNSIFANTVAFDLGPGVFTFSSSSWFFLGARAVTFSGVMDYGAPDDATGSRWLTTLHLSPGFPKAPQITFGNLKLTTTTTGSLSVGVGTYVSIQRCALTFPMTVNGSLSISGGSLSSILIGKSAKRDPAAFTISRGGYLVWDQNAIAVRGNCQGYTQAFFVVDTGGTLDFTNKTIGTENVTGWLTGSCVKYLVSTGGRIIASGTTKPSTNDIPGDSAGVVDKNSFGYVYDVQ